MVDAKTTIVTAYDCSGPYPHDFLRNQAESANIDDLLRLPGITQSSRFRSHTTCPSA